jgi:S-DNA-T family DNA segregation ATPase FtsK/SpoIIIE
MSIPPTLPSANFNRPPRLQLPTLPDEVVEIPPPPKPADLPEQSLWITMLPVLGIGVMALFYVLRAFGGDTFGSAIFAIPMLLLAVFTIGGTIAAQRWRRREYRRRQIESDTNYLRLLERKQIQLQAAHDVQLALLQTQYPAPETYLNRALAPDAQLWERRPEDDDFLSVRPGLGRVLSAIKIRTPHAETDATLLDRALALADQYRLLPDAPVVLSLKSDHALGMYGKRASVLKNMRALLCQLALTHSPQDLHVYLISSKASLNDWRWLRWLPHINPTEAAQPEDRIAFTMDHTRRLLGTLAQLMDERRENRQVSRLPHVLVIFDVPQPADMESVFTTLLREGHLAGMSVMCLTTQFEDVPSDCRTVLEITPDERFLYQRIGDNNATIVGSQLDTLPLPDAEHIARALASIQMTEIGSAGRIPPRVDFLELYNAQYVEDLLDIIKTRWRRQIQKGVLPHPVPIGRESLAVTTELLFDEDHHGPHGVLAGTTGSGKSELLQALVCGLALEHDPRLLNMLLIDFKGGSTFNVFAELPHVVGMVTNLDGVHIRRTLEALKAEIQWRQEFLKQKNMRDITQYHRYFSRSDDQIRSLEYEPLPHLFIIVDEFAQLAREMPDFMQELVRTAQIGRSLGLHLILGTQSPMDVITDDMNANLQFRICLRVQNTESSRAMLRRPDAAYLPSGQPGRGYLQVGERGVFKLFQTAYAGAEYEPDSGQDQSLVLELVTDEGNVVNLMPENPSSYPGLDAAQPYTVARAISDLITAYSEKHKIPHQRPLLLDPLTDKFTLAEPYQRIKPGGWNGQVWQPAGYDHEGYPIPIGSAPIGLVDDVYNRTQHPLWLHLNMREQGKDGHVLIVGSPGSGKTMALRTIALSLALLHAPDAVHLYFLSFTGTGLNDISQLPHAGRVIHGTETERMRRLFGRLIQILENRQAATARSYKPQIVVFIDQFEQFRDACRDTHLGDFERLINEGRSAGIYVVFTASSVAAVPDRVRSLVQQRIALHIGNPSDYVLMVGRIEGVIDDHLPPGRGYVYQSPPLLCQISLPSRGTNPDDHAAAEDMQTTIQAMRRAYLAIKKVRPDAATQDDFHAPPPVRELPTRVPFASLLNLQPLHHDPTFTIKTPLGRHDDDALTLFTLDWRSAGPDFVITGSPGSGKTNLLHAAILMSARQYAPQQLRFILVDVNRRSLHPLIPLKHVLKYVTDAADLRAQLMQLQAELAAAHTPENEIKPALEYPATVIVIDDYDSLTEALSLEPDVLRLLRDLLRQYGDTRLFVWVAGYLERTSDPLMKHLLLRRAGFAFSTKESLQKLYVRTVHLSGDAMPEGRAYFARSNGVQVVQMALVEDTAQQVTQLNNSVWRTSDRAKWHSLAVPVSSSQAANLPAASPNHGDVEIDVAGLIEDLLGKKPE